jgi:hypothetical protein
LLGRDPDARGVEPVKRARARTAGARAKQERKRGEGTREEACGAVGAVRSSARVVLRPRARAARRREARGAAARTSCRRHRSRPSWCRPPCARACSRRRRGTTFG